MSNSARADEFVQRVERFASRHAMFRRDKTYLVALSGGADSVALLVALQRLGIKIAATHCNFRLRGEESERDERFVRGLCESRNIPLHVTHFDTREFAAMRHMSIEMAARHLRYAYFRQLSSDIGAEAVCVAHHRDDSAETVLLNLLRGTGLKGMQGIRPIRQYHKEEEGGNAVMKKTLSGDDATASAEQSSPGRSVNRKHSAEENSSFFTLHSSFQVLRPLLCVDRSDIETFLSDIEQSYVTDSTNLETDAMRNKIRLEVMPILRRIAPDAVGAILRTAEHAAEAEHVIDAAMQRMEQEVAVTTERGITVSIPKLLRQPSTEHALFHLLTPFGFTPEAVKSINESIKSASGKHWLSATHAALIDRDSLIVERNDANDEEKEYRLPEEGTYIVSEGTRITVVILPFQAEDGDVKTCVEAMIAARGGKYRVGETLVAFDADKLSLPVTIRRTRTGDRFRPFGMRGTQLVSDFLTNRKRNLFEKRRQLVLTDSAANILWVVGERAADMYRIDGRTNRIVVVSAKKIGLTAPFLLSLQI